MISATAWIPRGYASEFPERYDLNDEEMARIEAMSELNLKDANEDLEDLEDLDDVKTDGLKTDIENDEDLKEYDFEHYDDEEVDEAGEPIVMFPGLSNTEATYIKRTTKIAGGEEEGEEEEEVEEHFLELPTKEEEEEEQQELQVYPTDNLILATRTEDDVSYLDVYVYDDGAGQLDADDTETDSYDRDVKKGLVREGNMYIHHDLMLPSFPICVEWLSFKPNGPNDESNVANFGAIGTFEPTIEIWNLDSIDKAFPDAILGEEEYSKWNSNNKKGKKKKSKKSSSTSPDCHTDAVVSLSHNRIFRNVLCSTSADTTVKLWDLTSCKVARAIDDGLHSGQQVSSSAWMPSNGNTEEGGSVLLTGGYDSNMKLSDVRVEDVIKSSKSYKCGQGEEIESVNWMGDDKILAGCDNGNVYCFDIRKEDKPVWTLHAHDSGITTLSSNNFCSGLVGTGAMKDREMKLWNVKDGKPSLVLKKDFGCGNVLSSGFSNDLEIAGHLVIGGTSPGLKLWDAFSNKTISSTFRAEISAIQERAKVEAQSNNRTSRIARKYKRGYTETIVSPEVGGSEVTEEADEED